jgi:hypothetical protein
MNTSEFVLFDGLEKSHVPSEDKAAMMVSEPLKITFSTLASSPFGSQDLLNLVW